MILQGEGKRITEKSFQIITERLEGFHCSPPVFEIVKRIAHTTGDVAFARTFHIPEPGLDSGIKAARNGSFIITDVEMVRTGIRKRWADTFGCQIRCFLNDPWVLEESRKTGQAEFQ